MGERPTNPNIPKPEIPKQEVELTPEVIEIVMRKVEDICTSGTAYHVFNANRYDKKKEILVDVLRDGILGLTQERIQEQQRLHQEKKDAPYTQRGAYVEDVRGGELPRLWFDIVGRSKGTYGIENSYWMNSYRYNRAPINIAIVFDLLDFTDGIGGREEYLEQLEDLKKSGSEKPADDYIRNHSRIGTYFPADTRGPKDPAETDWWNRNNQTMSASDEGHVLFGRISPRYFKGIVLKVNNLEESKETNSLEEERDPVIIQNEMKKIVDLQLKVYKLKPDNLIPIYDTRGNLLWPKQMNHEDLKKEEEEK